jgi:hypothetical protein
MILHLRRGRGAASWPFAPASSGRASTIIGERGVVGDLPERKRGGDGGR